MATAAETSDFDQNVGREVRALHKNRKLTLAQLAASAGCSIGYLSEVERGTRTVSIKFLSGIADTLDVPLGWFFSHGDQPDNEAGKLVRAASRKPIGSKEDGLFEELLGTGPNGATGIRENLPAGDLVFILLAGANACGEGPAN